MAEEPTANQETGRRRPWWQIAAAAAVLVIVAGAVGIVLGRSTDDDRVATGNGGTDTSVAITEPGPTDTGTSAAPTAADQLAPFFSAASSTDAALRAAATAINGHLTADSITVDPALTAAVRAASPEEARAAIPAGMSPDLLRAVLLVYSGLTSRFDSIACISTGPGTHPRSELEPGCFEHGGPAADRFAADLAAAQSRAQATPTFVVPAPDSKGAEELEVRLSDIDLHNNGCAGTGGYLATELLPVTIYPEPTVPPGYSQAFDGEIETIRFTATYVAGHGWTIELLAC